MNRDQIKHTASEIVRAMTNYKLTEEQKKVLEDRARIVIDNQLSKATSNKSKTVKWFKEGERIPADARLIDTMVETERYQPSCGGYATRRVTSFLYEYEVE